VSWIFEKVSAVWAKSSNNWKVNRINEKNPIKLVKIHEKKQIRKKAKEWNQNLACRVLRMWNSKNYAPVSSRKIVLE
jgi:hypothetical protein